MFYYENPALCSRQPRTVPGRQNLDEKALLAIEIALAEMASLGFREAISLSVDSGKDFPRGLVTAIGHIFL